MTEDILPAAEMERLCVALRTYVEEFGADCVTVTVPEWWSPYAKRTLGGKVAVEFSNKYEILIKSKDGANYLQILPALPGGSPSAQT